jgi:hypothetical protein
MRSSLLRSGFVTIGAAVALAACSGQSGMVPSQNNAASTMSMQSAPSAVSAISALALTACQKLQPAWVFEGACKEGDITSKGLTIALPAYKGITLAIAIKSNTAKGTVPFVLADALDKSDITAYKGVAFPPYNKNTGVVIYADGVNRSTQSPKVLDPVKIVVGVSTKFPGAYCNLAYFTGKTWTPLPGASVKPIGKKVGLNISPALLNSKGGLKPGPLYLAIYCNNVK